MGLSSELECSFRIEFTIKSSFSLLSEFNGIWKFMVFILFKFIIISVNFFDQLVMVICDPVFERRNSLWEWIDANYCFLHKFKQCF